MNSNGSIIIDNVEQLSNFQQLLINQGYRAPLNKNGVKVIMENYLNPKENIRYLFKRTSRN